MVKNPTNVSFNLSNSTIYYGENITVTGLISSGGATVTLNYTADDVVVSKVLSTNSSGVFNDVYMPNTRMCNVSTIERHVYTNSNGTFIASFKPDLIGTWRVQAKFDGDDLRSESHSEMVLFLVTDTWMNQNPLYIILGVVAIIIVFVAVVFIRK